MLESRNFCSFLFLWYVGKNEERDGWITKLLWATRYHQRSSCDWAIGDANFSADDGYCRKPRRQLLLEILMQLQGMPAENPIAYALRMS